MTRGRIVVLLAALLLLPVIGGCEGTQGVVQVGVPPFEVGIAVDKYGRMSVTGGTLPEVKGG